MAKIKQITVHAGHNKQGKVACGASDYIDESRQARIITRKVVRLLRANGLTVYNCTVNNGTSQNDVLKKIVAKCNSHKRQLDVAIHFNAAYHAKADGKTKGVEVYGVSESGVRGGVGNRICTNISKIGFTNRGFKARTNLYFLNKTTAPAILIEVCFVDDQDDARLYLKNKDAVAKAIVSAIMSYNKTAA